LHIEQPTKPALTSDNTLHLPRATTITTISADTLKMLVDEWTELTQARDEYSRTQFERETAVQQAERILILRTSLEAACDQVHTLRPGHAPVHFLGVFAALY
jgi:hypothetical protein